MLYFYAAHLLQEEGQTLREATPKAVAEAVWRGYRVMCAAGLPWHLAQIFRFLPNDPAEASTFFYFLFARHTGHWFTASHCCYGCIKSFGDFDG